ncbi:MAG: resolvase [Synechococcaceae cyanobacterium SM2_3_1]|nr:resolvase [Synechococcaceae cyanobacterium SM2_3_1]
MDLKLVAPDQVITPQTGSSWVQLLAEIPAALHRRRVCQGHAQNRLATKPPPGRAPYGYRREEDRYALNRRQAAAIKEFFDHFLLYGSLRGAVRLLQSKYGKRISVATGRRWLSNPVYRGDLHFRDGTTIRNTHTPILSRQEAAQIDRWLKRNQGVARRSASAPRSLAGLVLCQHCQQTLRVVQVTQRGLEQRYLYLRCQTCRYSHTYETVLDQVIDSICQELPRRIAGFNQQPLENLRTSVEAGLGQIELILSKINELEADGILDEITAQQRRYQLQGENAQMLKQLEQLPPENLAEIGQALSIAPFWKDLSEAERRAYLREFIQKIGINREGEVEIHFFLLIII